MYCPEQDGEIGYERLSRLLKECRLRIPQEQASLGHFERQPVRIGQPVTQVEIAQACGISRQWYVLMENDRSVRVSANILRRVAEVLMMSAAERAVLFRLAVPELRSVSPARRSTHGLDALVPFRRLTRKLWAATTKAEALTTAREYALSEFGSDAVTTTMRLDEKCWDFALNGVEHERSTELKKLLRWYIGAAPSDRGYVHGFATQPSDVLTRLELDARFPKRAATLREALSAANCPDLSVAMVRIEPQVGLDARLMLVHYRLRGFTAQERAQLAALAGILSLALSHVS